MEALGRELLLQRGAVLHVEDRGALVVERLGLGELAMDEAGAGGLVAAVGDRQDPRTIEGHDAFLHCAIFFLKCGAIAPQARNRNARLRPYSSQSASSPIPPSRASHGHRSRGAASP